MRSHEISCPDGGDAPRAGGGGPWPAGLRAPPRRSREIFEPEDAAASDRQPPLPALLAWEARIESVREWPFDTPTLVRFALFLLIPLGSWLGGAVVERVVDLVLD